ncbi:hypothetical protein UY3_00823 [Chelonia mydas]|uniref:Uncharacterized protein n=1 Tax=Chelonia mydas TaxID=8469 RepID=M7CLC9_CHEMY|nr:hypothetical protein UY3_00823 [Chelonia mydas]
MKTSASAGVNQCGSIDFYGATPIYIRSPTSWYNSASQFLEVLEMSCQHQPVCFPGAETSFLEEMLQGIILQHAQT